MKRPVLLQTLLMAGLSTSASTLEPGGSPPPRSGQFGRESVLLRIDPSVGGRQNAYIERTNVKKLRSKWMWLLATAVACSSPPNPPPSQQAEGEAPEVELLFVQNAAGVEFDDGTMTLTGVSPTTLYFSDRPHRIAGHVGLESLLYTLSQEGTFRDVPPNAVLVMLDNQAISDVVVVLTARPELEGDRLTFPVQILEGDPPASASRVSLFIDSAGQPDVWQTPGTVPRDNDQPGTVADNYHQPGTIGSNYEQPKTLGSDYEQPGEIGDEDVDVDARRGRYDPRGPYHPRGRVQ